MKTKTTLLLLAFVSFSLSCGLEDDDEKSECYTESIEFIDFMWGNYERGIAEIRDPDGTWHTHEQCVEQHDLAAEFYDKFITLNISASSLDNCSDDEVRELENITEAKILELEGDRDIFYNCD